jgi:hypothetical protein
MAAAALVAAATIPFWNQRVERDADRFLQAVFHERWMEVYGFMGPAERNELGLTSQEFAQFCSGFAKVAWPRRDHVKMEEMVPYVPAHADVDTSWNEAGTRKFSVTFYRPDNAVDLDCRIDFRHDRSGEWHPDVFPFIFSIGKSMPHGRPAFALLEGLKACGRTTLETYPFHQKTSIQELEHVVTTHKGAYLRSPPQPLH